MSFVFVSHAAPDKRPHVRPLVQALAIEGVPLWIDRPGPGPDDFQLPPAFVARHGIQGLRLGQDWDDGIQAALREAGAVLICLSRAALEPGREVLQQEMFGAQLTRKAVSCIVDDLDLSAMPPERGLLSLGKSQSVRVDAEALSLAVDWLLADEARTPEQLPKLFQPAWQAVRLLRDELQRTRSEAQALAPATGSARYRWPEAIDFDPFIGQKRESFEGREWLFHEIDCWLNNPAASRALLVRADFGVGKSALLAQYITTHRATAGASAVLAWHCCQHDTQETLQPGAFVRHLAAQLAQALPAYRAEIESNDDLQDRLDRALTDPGSAFERAVLGPLAKLDAPDAPRLLVIDALDEALELDAEDARKTGSLVKLLADKAGRFPRWLRVLATSRPNPEVIGPLQQAFALTDLDAEGAGNTDDLRRCVLARLRREPMAQRVADAGQTADGLADLLVAKSGGKFLFAVRALRDLEAGNLAVDEFAALPAGMDAFYRDAFQRRFERTGRDYAPSRELLGVVCAAREPMSRAELAEVMGCGEATIQELHRALPDFLRLRNKRLAFDHFSLAEWLTREDEEGFARAGPWRVDLLAAQRRLHDWALARVQAGNAHTSAYLLRHLASHLPEPTERATVFAQLMLERFEWSWARLQGGGPEALLADATQLAGHPQQALLVALLRNCPHVLRRHPSQWPMQLLGRVGVEGLGGDKALARLAQAAQAWLRTPAGRALGAGLLQPLHRSLPLQMAVEQVVEGGYPLVVLPDGRLACASGSQVRVWYPDRPDEVLVLEGHTREVRALAVLLDGRIASGSFDNTVRVWNPAQPSQVLVFEGHTYLVLALAVLPDGRIASGSGDNTVRVWNPAQPSEVLVLEGHTNGVQALAVLPDGRIASGSEDNTVRVWNPAQPSQVLVLEGHTDKIWALAVLPDGRIASGSKDKTVRVWNPAQPSQVLVFEGHTDEVLALAVLPDGRIASAGSWDNTVRVWNPAQPSQVLELEGHTGEVNALAVLPDGRIASGSWDHTVRVWNPAQPSQVLVLEGHTYGVRALAVLPYGRIASGSWDKTVRVWNPAQPDQVLVLEGHTLGVLALAVLPDGRIASGSQDKTVRVWNPAQPSQVLVFEGHTDRVLALAVLPDGRIASGSLDKTVRVWNPAQPSQVLVLEGHTDLVRALAVLPDGRIASGSWDKTVRVWNPAQPSHVLVLEGHTDRVQALAVLPDGRIASGSEDNTVRVWNPAQPSQVLVLEGRTDLVLALSVLPDGRIASGSRDKTVRVWNPAQPSHVLVFEGHTDRVLALSVLPDGRIASGSEDNTVRVWNPAQPSQVLVLEGHTYLVLDLAVLPGWRIASGAADNTVRVWDSMTGRQLRLFVADAPVSCLAVRPDGLIAVGCSDGGVHLLRDADQL